MAPQISERARLMPASPIRKLAPLADAAKRRGTHVLHLNIGQPDLETPAVMRSRLAAAPRVLVSGPGIALATWPLVALVPTWSIASHRQTTSS